MLVGLIIFIIFAVGLDQLTKAVTFERVLRIIPGFIRFESVKNEGMVWGMMNGVKGFVTAITIVTALVIVLLIWVFFKYRSKMSGWIRFAFAMIIAGAIGNLIDRAALGYVRDFICTEFISFPVFNVADIFVTCGAVLLGILLIFTRSGHELFAAVFPDEKKKDGEGPVPEAEA